MKITRSLLFVALMMLPFITKAQDWKSKEAPLMTSYSKDINPQSVLPEYPRPQMVREKWMNLNGLWQYQAGTWENEPYPKGKLKGSILVPFAVESALSGVMEHHDRLWYRRQFSVPTDWKGQQLLLHFGAVDYESEVFINNKSVGKHLGGYDPFTFDITPFLTEDGPQDITVKVYDPTDAAGNPRGKQSLNPGGIMYTSVTGIWQTVWLEPVPKVNIKDFRIIPDIDKSVIKLTVSAEGMPEDCYVNAQVLDGDKVIQTMTGKPGVEIIMPVKKAKLWSPDSPFLYNMNISLVEDGRKLDEVASYFGMRKISVENNGGVKKLYLNNKFLFQIGPLDQGFWPDGIYTAPTDEAIKSDIQHLKSFGFNMVRKHIKVEPYRWYYWADKLGVMVWQDMPSPNSYTDNTPPVNQDAYKHELTRLVETHWNIPSIVIWVIFNEGQGQHKTKELADMVKSMDGSRLVNQASGGGYFDAGDILDVHSYPAPGCPNSKTQALACGEYGGIGYKIPGHLWVDGFGYVMANNEKEYLDLYKNFANTLTSFKTNSGLSAAVYTQLTDVESELNGLLTYDRVEKVAPEKIRACNKKVVEENLYVNDILPTSLLKGRSWKYTTTDPGKDWYAVKADVENWRTGEAGFGLNAPGENTIRTSWSTSDIWIRQEFTIGNISKIDRDDLVLNIYHDDECEVFINGVQAAVIPEYTTGYIVTKLSKETTDILIPNDKNVIAIHCRQHSGGQYIDAGISLITTNKHLSESLKKGLK